MEGQIAYKIQFEPDLTTYVSNRIINGKKDKDFFLVAASGFVFIIIAFLFSGYLKLHGIALLSMKPEIPKFGNYFVRKPDLNLERCS